MVAHKQAVLILAHNNIEQLITLASLLNEYFKIFIHFDKKTYFKYPKSLKNRLETLPNVFVYSQYKVHWGAFSIVEATILLASESLRHKDIEYFHLISGLDWITKNPEEIYQYFMQNDSIYMTYESAENVVKGQQGEQCVLLWQKFYYPYDIINRRSTFGKFFHHGNMIMQKILRIDKLKHFKISFPLYIGSEWWSMPREPLEYVCSCCAEQQNIIKVMRSGFCSDEFLFQTILYNSEKYKKKIKNENFRFILWKQKYDSYPAILDDEDYELIKNSGAFFMRKVDFEISSSLLSKLGVKHK